MAETMYDAPGIGLAAPQVGRNQRVIVVDAGDDPETESTAKLYKLVNPEIVAHSGKVKSPEGCLSIPGVRETVSRYESVEVSYLDEHGEKQLLKADGMLSIVLQHEIDHLNGITIFDRRIPNGTYKAPKRIGRNELVTIKKGDAVKVLKYKKAEKFLNDNWTLQ